MKLILPLLVCLVVCGCKSTPEPFVVAATPPLPQSAVARMAPPAPPLPVGNVTLAFDIPFPIDFSITGYRIYYRNEADITVRVDTTSTTNSVAVEPGESYKFWAVSRDSAGVESVPSNEVSYTVPPSEDIASEVVIILWTGPSAQGPWPVALTTNRVPATNVQAYFYQTITLE